MLKVAYVDTTNTILIACIIFVAIILIGFLLNVCFENPGFLLGSMIFSLSEFFIIMMFAMYTEKTNATDTADVIKQLDKSKISISNIDAEELSKNLYGKNKYTFRTTDGQTLHFSMFSKTKKGFLCTTTYKVKVDVDKKNEKTIDQ